MLDEDEVEPLEVPLEEPVLLPDVEVDEEDDGLSPLTLLFGAGTTTFGAGVATWGAGVGAGVGTAVATCGCEVVAVGIAAVCFGAV